MAGKAPAEVGEPPSVASLSISETANKGSVEQQIDPWSVQAATDAEGNALAFDYEAISKKWATQLIDKALIERFESLTGVKAHHWLTRGLFFSHRDFNKILDTYEAGKPFFLYTGRGPSSGSMHIGHTISFEFTKYLSDAFDVPLVIMLTDDEKAIFKDSLTVEETMHYSRENCKDIIAMDFSKDRTFIYSDLKYIGGAGAGHHMMLNAWEFSKLVNFNQVRGAFGFDGSTGTGRIFFPNLQCVAAFGTSYPHVWGDAPEQQDEKQRKKDPFFDQRQKKTAAIPCLIPCGIDQDPYFRLVRDNAGRMKNPSPKPALIHAKFLTSLQGAGGKMSASIPNSAIFMSDKPNEIKNKINRHAFSGGQETKELQEKLGGNPDVDVAYQYLSYFDSDDEKLTRIAQEYREGKLMTGEMKKMCIELMQSYVKGFQERRAKVTDEVMNEFMTPRRLQWRGKKTADERKAKASEAQ